MRLLLLLALVVRFLPIPGGGAHCVAAPGSMAVAGHAHHQPPSSPDHPADCPHCPPSQCAAAVECGVVLAALAIAPARAPTTTEVTTVAPTLASDRWTSRDHRPPVPPPVRRLT